jgi:hypothetical protein
MECDDLFVIERLSNSRSLCISTLAKETITESESQHLGSDKGLFVYEVDDSLDASGVQVLAKVASLEAAFKLIDLWKGRLI